MTARELPRALRLSPAAREEAVRVQEAEFPKPGAGEVDEMAEEVG